MSKSESLIVKTKHPTITQITMGEQFLLNNGDIVTLFSIYESTGSAFPFESNSLPLLYPYQFYNINVDRIDTYSTNLRFDILDENNKLNIKCKYIPIKDKLNQL
jgi:hypothetical protein